MSSPQLSPWGSALAGAMAAVFANASLYPLDTVKTRLQVADEPAVDAQKLALPSDDADLAQAPRRSSSRQSDGIMQGLVRILKEEGIAGYYKGFVANTINTFSMQYAYFFFYSLVRSLYLARQRRRQTAVKGRAAALGTAAELLLGALAGALAQIFTIPVAVIATRQQLSKPSDGKELSLLGVAREIITEDGPAGLWRGLRPGLVLTVNPAITYGVSSRLKEVIIRRQGTSKLSPWQSFALGASPRASQQSSPTPIAGRQIMAKVRLQARRFPSSSAVTSTSTTGSTVALRPGETPPTTSYASVARGASVASDTTDVTILPRRDSLSSVNRGGAAIEVLRQVYETKGFTGLYQGMNAQIFKAVLAQGILFTVKDQFEMYAYMLLLLFSRPSVVIPAAQVAAVTDSVKQSVEGQARAVGRQLPSAQQGLKLAEKAATTVGKDVVEKLAVEAVVSAVQR